MKTQRNSDEMFALIEELKTSGASARDFCSVKGISYATLQYWIAKYKKHQDSPSKSDSSFIPLNIDASGSCMDIIFPSGVRIVFHQPVQADFVRQLLS
jgi:hypothetical protein